MNRRNFTRVSGTALATCSFCAAQKLFAQTAFPLSPSQTCNFSRPLTDDSIYTFGSSGTNSATPVVNRILEAIGLTTDRTLFKVVPANVRDAAAVYDNTERYILYSESFMQRVAGNVQSDWIGLSIMAHEIGHHLLFHTFQDLGSRPTLELEADRFSGRAVALLRGTLEQAQAAVNQFAPANSTASHPPRSARLEAVAVGFRGVPPPTTARSDDTRRLEAIKAISGWWAGELMPRLKPESSVKIWLKIDPRGERDLAIRVFARRYSAGKELYTVEQAGDLRPIWEDNTWRISFVGQTVKFNGGDREAATSYTPDSFDVVLNGAQFSGSWRDANRAGAINLTRQ